jgi:hypothetical protein
MNCCPDCGVSPGEWHVAGCDVEPCPYCGGQYVCCDCDDVPLDDRLAWTGYWPGELEAVRLGYFSVLSSTGWVPCTPDTPAQCRT